MFLTTPTSQYPYTLKAAQPSAFSTDSQGKEEVLEQGCSYLTQSKLDPDSPNSAKRKLLPSPLPPQPPISFAKKIRPLPPCPVDPVTDRQTAMHSFMTRIAEQSNKPSSTLLTEPNSLPAKKQCIRSCPPTETLQTPNLAERLKALNQQILLKHLSPESVKIEPNPVDAFVPKIKPSPLPPQPPIPKPTKKQLPPISLPQQELIKLAQDLARRHQWKEVLIVLPWFLTDESYNSQVRLTALILKAEAYGHLCNHKQCIAMANEALKIDPGHPFANAIKIRALLAITDEYLALCDFQQALSSVNEVLKYQPSLLCALEKKFHALVQLDKPTHAINTGNYAIQICLTALNAQEHLKDLNPTNDITRQLNNELAQWVMKVEMLQEAMYKKSQQNGKSFASGSNSVEKSIDSYIITFTEEGHIPPSSLKNG